MNMFGGFTRYTTDGGWKGEREKGCVWEILGGDYNSVMAFARKVKEELGQECVYVAARGVKVEEV